MLKAQAAIKALYALATDEPLEFIGNLADACRAVLREGKPLTPLEVRKGIVALGYNLTKHKNPQASIHSVLKRLVESGDLKHVTASVTDDDGTTIDKAAYKWVQRDVPKRRRAASAVAPPVFYGGIDLPEIDLSGIFSGIDLPKIDFSGIDFPKIDFSGINSLLEQVKPMEAEAQRLAGPANRFLESVEKTAAPVAPHLGKLKK